LAWRSSSRDFRPGFARTACSLVSGHPALLIYVNDAQPGIRRERHGRGFCYRLPDGELLRNRKTRDRIRALGLPPAYEQVWICLRDDGHLQATGLDARGRKPYRYHHDR